MKSSTSPDSTTTDFAPLPTRGAGAYRPPGMRASPESGGGSSVAAILARTSKEAPATSEKTSAPSSAASADSSGVKNADKKGAGKDGKKGFGKDGKDGKDSSDK